MIDLTTKSENNTVDEQLLFVYVSRANIFKVPRGYQ